MQKIIQLFVIAKVMTGIKLMPVAAKNSVGAGRPAQGNWRR
jgi:hypothetical protein